MHANKAQEAQRQKKPRNIIAMTRGFIENRIHKGDDWLERKGDDKKRPSFEELKYLSYEQHINWQLQAAWKRHYAHQSYIHPLEGQAIISFIIDAQGNVSKLELLQSSGIQKLDDIILENTRRAAPFPPLPKHFNTSSYPTGRIIHVQAQSFGF
ncbi:MAG: energy transducer TonB [bacterium]